MRKRRPWGRPPPAAANGRGSSRRSWVSLLVLTILFVTFEDAERFNLRAEPPRTLRFDPSAVQLHARGRTLGHGWFRADHELRLVDYTELETDDSSDANYRSLLDSRLRGNDEFLTHQRSDMDDPAPLPPEVLPVPNPFADSVRPEILRVPTDPLAPMESPSTEATADDGTILQWPFDAPLGFSGPSGVLPSEVQLDSHFVPVEDRWRVGFPAWDRDEEPNTWMTDSPYVEGWWLDPYNQNVLKGDYPIIGQHTFLNLTAATSLLQELRQVPTPTSPFESTDDPFSEEFFGNPNQYFYSQNFVLSADLLHGDAAFKPADWRIKVNSIFNLNYLDVEELAVVNPDVTKGKTRFREDYALEEWFVETKLADLSPNYDFVSVRAGSQNFVSDFRGFIFADLNRGVRLFGNRNANRGQFNVVWFDQTEKDTNSLLNTFDDRHQNTVIANYYQQDFIWPGYTSELSFHYNRDQASIEFDRNDFLVRPDPVGVFQPHRVDAYYLGWAGNGHINRVNVSHAFYWALGRDELNPLAGRELSINAQMAALELSYDRDWMRFRSSFFWSSGDDDINDGQGEGFDAIFDNPNFAGGEFSYWQRQTVKLFGVNLVNRQSLLPNLRSSKFQGQTNFVNPGLYLFNVGVDADITPKFKLISNANLLWFEETEVLEQFVFQGDIDNFIGADLSLGAEYRPYHNNNVVIVGGISGLIADEGFQDLYNPIVGNVGGLFASFLDVVLTY